MRGVVETEMARLTETGSVSPISKRALLRLVQPNEWVCDESLDYICAALPVCYPDVTAISACGFLMFRSKVTMLQLPRCTDRKGYAGAGRAVRHLISRWPWMRKRKDGNPLKKQYIFVPVHYNENHWVLFVATPADRVIYVLDSMGGRVLGGTGKLHRNFTAYVDAFRLILYAVEVAHSPGMCNSILPWSAASSDCPQQKNSDDCGVFVAMAMVGITQGERREAAGIDIGEWATSQNSVDRARMALGAVIITLGVGVDFLQAEGRRTKRKRDAKLGAGAEAEALEARK
jgi:hypothetical protein